MAVRRAPRVLLTADTVGGVWSYAVELVKALDARGVEVAIATMGAPVAPHQRDALADCAHTELFESRFKLEWMQDAADDVAGAGDWLLALARDWRPDVVHLNQYAFGALRLEAPSLLVAHSCVASWWRAVHGVAAPPEWDAYRRLVRDGLRGASLVAAPTRSMLASLAENYGYRRGGLVLPNAAEPAQFAPGPKQPVVLAAGRFWDQAKNLRALQQAAGGLSWPVQVAGACTHPDGGTVQPQGVSCLGELPREALARHLASASIFAHPARYEPFGLAVLEAGLSGCALVLGDIPSLRELWGPAARYVAPDDAQALRAALAQLIENAAERERLAAAARARALAFTPARQCDAYLAAYARLAPRFAVPTLEESLCVS